MQEHSAVMQRQMQEQLRETFAIAREAQQQAQIQQMRHD